MRRRVLGSFFFAGTFSAVHGPGVGSVCFPPYFVFQLFLNNDTGGFFFVFSFLPCFSFGVFSFLFCSLCFFCVFVFLSCPQKPGLLPFSGHCHKKPKERKKKEERKNQHVATNACLLTLFASFHLPSRFAFPPTLLLTKLASRATLVHHFPFQP